MHNLNLRIGSNVRCTPYGGKGGAKCRLTDRLKGYGSDEESSAELTASEESSACSSASSVTQEAEEDSKRILPPYTELSRWGWPLHPLPVLEAGQLWHWIATLLWPPP